MSVYIPTFETKNKSQFLTQDENATGLNQGQMIHFCDGDCNEQKDEKLAWKSWIDNKQVTKRQGRVSEKRAFSGILYNKRNYRIPWASLHPIYWDVRGTWKPRRSIYSTYQRRKNINLVQRFAF